MAISPNFFNKRVPETTPPPRHVVPTPSTSSYGAPVAPSAPAVAATPVVSEAKANAPVVEGGSKLTVGPNIKLKGVEITDCDTLLVEGTVEATMDSRVIQISERGAFKGSAEIDIAEIHGQFDGDLTVREKLTIYATGKVTGKVHYGKLVIEEGGQLTGEIKFGSIQGSRTSNMEKSGVSLV